MGKAGRDKGVTETRRVGTQAHGHGNGGCRVDDGWVNGWVRGRTEDGGQLDGISPPQRGLSARWLTLGTWSLQGFACSQN